MISATSAWHNRANWSAFFIKLGFLLVNCCVLVLAAYGIL